MVQSSCVATLIANCAITGDSCATSHAYQSLLGSDAVACHAWKPGSCHGTSLALRLLQVVDSPFSKLTELMLELVEEQKIPIPRSLMRVALSMMRRSVKKRAGFSIDEVAPIDKIHTSFIPVLFGEQHVCICCSCVAADQLFLNQINTCFGTVLFGEQHACIHRAPEQRLSKPDPHLLCYCSVWQAPCLHKLPTACISCPATWRHANSQLLC